MKIDDVLGDNIGSVELLDSMGTDLTVVNAARVSFDKQREKFSDDDEKLIKYLAKHNHWTPFSQCTAQLRIKMPICIARQWFKSQIGLTRNEVSRRYVKSDPEFFIPKEWRLSAKNVKQGSSNELSKNKALFYKVKSHCKDSSDLYNILLKSDGICGEQARMVLPQNMYTTFIETGSLVSYARIYGLRSDLHAQYEIQQYAKAVDKIMKKIYPVSWKFLTKER